MLPYKYTTHISTCYTIPSLAVTKAWLLLLLVFLGLVLRITPLTADFHHEPFPKHKPPKPVDEPPRGKPSPGHKPPKPTGEHEPYPGGDKPPRPIDEPPKGEKPPPENKPMPEPKPKGEKPPPENKPFPEHKPFPEPKPKGEKPPPENKPFPEQKPKGEKPPPENKPPHDPDHLGHCLSEEKPFLEPKPKGEKPAHDPHHKNPPTWENAEKSPRKMKPSVPGKKPELPHWPPHA